VKKHIIPAVCAALLTAVLLSSCNFVISGPASGTSASTDPMTAESDVQSSSDTETPTENQTTEETGPETEPETEAPVTTEAVTEEQVTTEEVTEEPVTAEEETTGPSPDAFVIAPPEGAETVGYTERGYAIQTKDGFWYVGGILVVNKTYSIPSDYVPEGYAMPMQDKVENRMLPEAQEKFVEMQKAFKEENPDAKGFKIQSGYRSYLTQNRLYTNYVSKHGQAYADTYSARPGHSEHQTGLAADLNVVGTSTLYESIKDTTEGKWLAANSWKYGFILRYPEGKTPVTGYIFEPWHFRYVGVEAATAVYESGLSLEEFLGIDSVYRD